MQYVSLRPKDDLHVQHLAALTLPVDEYGVDVYLGYLRIGLD